MGLVVLFAVDAVLVGVALRSTDASGLDTSLLSSAAVLFEPVFPDAVGHNVGRISRGSNRGCRVNCRDPLQIMLVAVNDKRA